MSTRALFDSGFDTIGLGQQLRRQYLSTKSDDSPAGSMAEPRLLYAFVFDNEHRSTEASIRAKAEQLRAAATLKAGAGKPSEITAMNPCELDGYWDG